MDTMQGMMDEAERLEQSGNVQGALEAYRKAQKSAGSGSATSREIQLIIDSIQARTGVLAPALEVAPLVKPPGFFERLTPIQKGGLLAAVVVGLGLLAGGGFWMTRGALEIRSTPPGATITLDGQVRGQTPLKISQLSPGSHTVSLSLDLFDKKDVTADAPSGKVGVLEVELLAREIKVGKSGDYVTLGEALQKAAPGARLALAAETFTVERPVDLDKPITIRGEGAQNTRIVGNVSGYLFHFKASGALVLKDLTIEQNGSEAADLLVVESGSVEITDSRISGAHFDERAQKGGVGLLAGHDCTTVSLSNVDASNNGNVGLSFADHVEVTVDHCESSGNGESGIRFYGRSKGTVTAGHFNKNGSNGILLGETSAPVLERNECSKNKHVGIRITGSSSPQVTGNMCMENVDDGIVALEQSSPTLAHNTCDKNGQVGVAFSGSSSGTAEHNEASTNAQFGIVVLAHAHPNLSQNTVTGNQVGGLWVKDATAQPQLEGNEVSGNSGFQVQDVRSH